MAKKEITKRDESSFPLAHEFSEEQIALIKNQVAKETTDGELKYFLQVCSSTRLNPFKKQIFCQKRLNRKTNQKEMAIVTTIVGYRSIAQRTGHYEGQEGPYWCGEDGVWKDVWLSAEIPKAARVGVYKTGFKQVLFGTCLYERYAQRSPTWDRMPEDMLAKCAEAQALRKAFPEELEGMYIQEEIADSEEQYIGTVDAAEIAKSSAKQALERLTAPTESAPKELPKEAPVESREERREEKKEPAKAPPQPAQKEEVVEFEDEGGYRMTFGPYSGKYLSAAPTHYLSDLMTTLETKIRQRTAKDPAAANALLEKISIELDGRRIDSEMDGENMD